MSNGVESIEDVTGLRFTPEVCGDCDTGCEETGVSSDSNASDECALLSIVGESEVIGCVADSVDCEVDGTGFACATASGRYGTDSDDAAAV